MKMIFKREMFLNQNNEKYLLKTIGYKLYIIQFMVPSTML